MLEDNIKRIHREFDPTHCWICKGSLNDMVRDHGHFTGKLKEEHLTTYATFNSRRQSLLLLSLNLAGYDYHLFVNNFSKTEGNIKCIPNKMRKITSASAKMSLLTLSSTKVKKLTSRMSFTLIKASSSWLLFSKGTEKVFMDKIKLVSRKGVYPYDYTDSITKFDVTELPPKDKFYSKLNDCDISNEDYEHTQNLWN